MPYLLTPYLDPATAAEKAFSHAHIRTRAQIEMVFGQLKSRFQCLKGLRVTPDRACDITVACAVLHNIATLRCERLPTMLLDEQWEDIEPALQEPMDGRTVRNLYRDTYFS